MIAVHQRQSPKQKQSGPVVWEAGMPEDVTGRRVPQKRKRGIWAGRGESRVERVVDLGEFS